MNRNKQERKIRRQTHKIDSKGGKEGEEDRGRREGREGGGEEGRFLARWQREVELV